MDKKKLKTGIISIVALILIVFAFKDGLSYNKVTETVDDGKYTITVVNTSPQNGELTIAVKQGDEYIDMEGNSVEVEPGTKTKTYFKDGNKGKTAFWAVNINGVMNYVYSSSVEKTLYKEDKFIKTVEGDITVYYFGEVENGQLVSFYDTSVEGKRNLVGLDYVSYGDAADDLGVIEQVRKGFSQTGWSEDLSCIKEDTEVYPTYKSNIYTIWRDYHSFFMHGLLITLLLSVVSVFLAMFMGVAICLVRLGDNKFFSFIATIYVEVIRGVPLLLQLLLIYVILGPTKISFCSFFTTVVLSCIITLTIKSSAYSSEIFRSGIQAVDKGQMEAGRALGLSKW